MRKTARATGCTALFITSRPKRRQAFAVLSPSRARSADGSAGRGGQAGEGCRGLKSSIYLAYLLNGAATVKTAKIFQHGNSQAVRLPKEFRFEEDEVVIKRHAGGVLLLPKRYSVDDLLEILQQFEGPIERGENAPAQKRKF